MLSAQPPRDTVRNENPPAIRPAELADAAAIARVSVDAFPDLFRSLYGRAGVPSIVAAHAALFDAGILEAARYRVATVASGIVGVCALNTTGEIGAPDFRPILKTVRRHMWLPAAFRAAIGISTTLAVVPRRIPYEPDLLYIEALAVDSQHRSRGIGTALLRHAAATAAAAGRGRLALHVMRDNDRACELYRRFGFVDWEDPPQLQWLARDSRLMILTIQPHHILEPAGSAHR